MEEQSAQRLMVTQSTYLISYEETNSLARLQNLGPMRRIGYLGEHARLGMIVRIDKQVVDFALVENLLPVALALADGTLLVTERQESPAQA